MNHNEVVSALMLEFRRGTLILMVLSQLREPMYGYNLVKILEENDVKIEANTLYPLMRRLETQGLLKSEWETSGAKPRKYYMITEDGDIVFEKLKTYWKDFSNRINLLLFLEGERDDADLTNAKSGQFLTEGNDNYEEK